MNVSGSLVLKSSLLTAAGFLALCLSTYSQDKPAPPETSAPAAAAPNSANAPSPANSVSFAYDVVSIKPVKVGMTVTMSGHPLPDGLTFRGFGISDFIRMAFPVTISNQIVGLPEWADTSRGIGDRFDLDAKMDEETVAAFNKLSREQQQEARRAMMIALLADRCKLKYHKETREMPIYNLVIGKNGPRFKETPPDNKGRWTGGWGEISGDNIKLDWIISNLSGQTRRVVIDKTGLSGKYSFSLKWNPLEGQDVPQSFLDQYPDFKNRPGLVDAIQEQLGLKLEPAKGPVDVYVIDHIEKPSPD